MKTRKPVSKAVTYPGHQKATLEFLTWLVDIIYSQTDDEPLSTEFVIDYLMKQTWHEGVKLLICTYLFDWAAKIYFGKRRGVAKEIIMEDITAQFNEELNDINKENG